MLVRTFWLVYFILQNKKARVGCGGLEMLHFERAHCLFMNVLSSRTGVQNGSEIKLGLPISHLNFVAGKQRDSMSLFVSATETNMLSILNRHGTSQDTFYRCS